MTKNRALYIGPSHAAGGIPVVVDGDKNVEVEGLEYKICGEAYRSQQHLDFKAKTNIEILDYIHNEFSCTFDQSKASGSDFIICKLAVRNLSKHDRSGTVREILDQMQGEVGCKLSNGSLPEPKMKSGGVLYGGFYDKKAFYGNKDTDYTNLFEQNYALGICTGLINKKIILEVTEDFDPVSAGKADLFDFYNCKTATVSDVPKIIAQAISIPGNTSHQLAQLDELSTQIPYHLFTSIPSIETAAKILGFDGLLCTASEPHPTICVIWDFSRIKPLVVSNAHNYKLLEHLNMVPNQQGQGDKHEAGGELTGYAQRVYENLKQMGTIANDWAAVPVIGTQKTYVNGKERDMPIFDFPQGYADAPTLYINHQGAQTFCCELCGKEPIATIYWIQNDTKKWTLRVGSECITHFQAKSGKEMLRDAKVEEAKEFSGMLKKVCLWLKSIGKKTNPKPEYLGHPTEYKRNMGDWRFIYLDTEHPISGYKGRAQISLWHFYKELYPHSYDDDMAYLLRMPVQRYDIEQKKWITTGPPDPATCRAEAEKNLLSWYSRNKKKKLEIIGQLIDLLGNQEGYMPKDMLPFSKGTIENSLKQKAELQNIIDNAAG